KILPYFADKKINEIKATDVINWQNTLIKAKDENVVLGADAEEVIVANQQGNNVPNKKYRFEYRTGSIENDQPVYNADGSMDLGILNSQGIQQHICDILEGGERAFELRKNKYHI
ncbi:MAG: hypothetical protein PUE34_03555, partial [Clostridiaceae bacterium]|nr:hypothetical protein [Clostridiaceae bacterium]